MEVRSLSGVPVYKGGRMSEKPAFFVVVGEIKDTEEEAEKIRKSLIKRDVPEALIRIVKVAVQTV
jgi:hypothetical protein